MSKKVEPIEGHVAEDASTPEARVKKVVHGTSAFSAALGAILSPIPLADELLLLPTYAWMSARIGAARGLPFRAVPWKPILSTVISGLGARAALNIAFAFVPGVAAVANAVSAVALTELIGAHADESCVDPAHAQALTPAAIVDRLKARVNEARARRAANA